MEDLTILLDLVHKKISESKFFLVSFRFAATVTGEAEWA